MAIKTVNNVPQAAESTLGSVVRSNPLIPSALIGRIAKRAMETSAGQRVTGFCGKVRQFSSGLIGRALGNTVKAVAVDGAGFAAGGSAVSALLAESAVTPYIVPATVVVAAGAAAYKSKSKKVRLAAALCGLTALVAGVLAFRSTDQQEGIASHLQGFGLALGVKAGQALGSFAAQRFVLGTKVDRYALQTDGWGRERQRVVESYPIRFIDFDQPTASHALRMGQYFVAKGVLPLCFIGESSTRDGLLGTLAYSAVPLHGAVNSYLEGRPAGLHGKFTNLAMDFIGDNPHEYASTLSKALLQPITPHTPDVVKKVLNKIPQSFLAIGEKLLSEIRNLLTQLPYTPSLEKTIYKILQDLPRIVNVVMHSLNEFGDIVRNSQEIQKMLREPEMNIDALDKAIGQELVKKYPSLNITDAGLALAVTPIASALADAIVSSQNAITGIPIHADRMQSNDLLTIYLKHLLMGIITNYSATIMHYNDKGGAPSPLDNRNLMQNAAQLFVGDARLLPEPLATAATKSADLFAAVTYALAPPAPPKQEVKRGLFGRVASWVGSKFNALSKIIFGTICKVVGAARRAFSRTDASLVRHTIEDLPRPRF